MLLFLQLGLGGRADADDGYTTRQFCQAFLQLFAVVIAGGLIDLGPDLVDARLNRFLFALAADNRGVVFISDDFLGLAQVGNGGGLEFLAHFIRNHHRAGQGGDVLQHCFAPVAKTWRLDCQHVEHAAQFV